LHDARIECSVVRTRTSYTIPFVVSAIAGKTKTKAKKVNKRAFLLTLASEKADIRYCFGFDFLIFLFWFLVDLLSTLGLKRAKLSVANTTGV
jgi:hypothetical protein